MHKDFTNTAFTAFKIVTHKHKYAHLPISFTRQTKSELGTSYQIVMMFQLAN